jgi:hypothetical protein
MLPCGNCGNRLMPSLSMMIASGFLVRQSVNLFWTSIIVRPANLISLSRIIAAGRATVERPRQRPRPNGGEGRDSNPRYSCPYAAFARCLKPLSHLSRGQQSTKFVTRKLLRVPAQETAPSAERRPALAMSPPREAAFGHRMSHPPTNDKNSAAATPAPIAKA